MEEAEEDPVGVSADGWIWAAGRLSNMNEDKIREWEEISNRVQFFRAEADYETWQEELERKHADFVFLIGSFTKQRDDWAILAKNFSSTPGHVAYAKEHSNMFEALRADAGLKYKHCGIGFLVNTPLGEQLDRRIMAWRAQEEKHFAFDRLSRSSGGGGGPQFRLINLKAKIRHLTVDWTFCALFNCPEYLVFNGAV
ncbi:hypothetical protein GGU11DRAFT_760400 [Lentinula aff. detonsa]|nr:hypothetical protein GGU11DRAFT_760400 [Lentinula aff. detonsa]